MPPKPVVVAQGNGLSNIEFKDRVKDWLSKDKAQGTFKGIYKGMSPLAAVAMGTGLEKDYYKVREFFVQSWVTLGADPRDDTDAQIEAAKESEIKRFEKAKNKDSWTPLWREPRTHSTTGKRLAEPYIKCAMCGELKWYSYKWQLDDDATRQFGKHFATNHHCQQVVKATLKLWQERKDGDVEKKGCLFRCQPKLWQYNTETPKGKVIRDCAYGLTIRHYKGWKAVQWALNTITGAGGASVRVEDVKVGLAALRAHLRSEMLALLRGQMFFVVSFDSSPSTQAHHHEHFIVIFINGYCVDYYIIETGSGPNGGCNANDYNSCLKKCFTQLGINEDFIVVIICDSAATNIKAWNDQVKRIKDLGPEKIAAMSAEERANEKMPLTVNAAFHNCVAHRLHLGVKDFWKKDCDGVRLLDRLFWRICSRSQANWDALKKALWHFLLDHKKYPLSECPQ